MVLKFLIINNEPAISFYIKTLVEKIPEICIADVATNSQEALEKTELHRPQAVLFNVDMPGKTCGLELAKLLAEIVEDISIVFFTACNDHVIRKLLLHPFGYIIKPLHEARIKKIVQQLTELQLRKPVNLIIKEPIVIDTQDKKLELKPDEIIYIESYSPELLIRTVRDTYQIKGSISTMEKRLDKYGFFRSHRSYLVNLGQIKEIIPIDYTFQIIMLSGDKVLLSRGRAKHLWKKLNNDIKRF